jgi:glycosyltransferase involved in cell wall biosynthesis
MRVGIDIRVIGKKLTGDEAVFFNLVKNLARIDSTNEYFLFTDIADETILKEIGTEIDINGKSNFRIIALPAKNKFQWNFWTLPTYLRKNPVDIYHTQYITPWFVPKKIKIVTIIHDISFNFFPQHIKFSDLFFLKTLIPISLQRADKIIAVSEFTKNEIIKFYKIEPGKIECVYNSISDEFLTDEIFQEKLDGTRKKYNLPDKFILYIGTLQPRKNIPMLLEAYAKTKDRLGDIKLVICGNQKAHNYDKRISNSLENNNLKDDIIFPGFIDEQDKKTIFQSAQAFVFPSFYEGFGIPVLEAMSQNVPVLAADIPSLKEIAKDGALYFDVASLDDFSKKLYAVSVDNKLREELTKTGKEIVSFFSWENSARKTLAIYEEM